MAIATERIKPTGIHCELDVDLLLRIPDAARRLCDRVDWEVSRLRDPDKLCLPAEDVAFLLRLLIERELERRR